MNRTRPTDEELMLYADDELDGPRRDEVEQQLAGDAILRRKVSALRLTSDLIRESAAEQAAGFSIADAVMARIATAKASVPLGDPAPAVPLGRISPVGTGTAARPANDNTRRIFGLAAVAVAAAAALMIWGRMESGPGAERSPVIAAQTAPKGESPAGSPTDAPRGVDAQLPAPSAPPTPGGDMEMGAEVAAVDFGAGSGSIFYVPRDSGLGAATAMTTVVWLADDVGGGR